MSKIQKPKPRAKPTQKQQQMKRGAKAPASSIDAGKSKAFISHQQIKRGAKAPALFNDADKEQKQMQNVVVHIHKPTRARNSKLQKEALPIEKRIPHPLPQFSFNPVISMPSVQSDSSITRHILKNQDRFDNELKKYALANSQADEIEALKQRFDKLTTGKPQIVMSDLSTRGASTRFVGDNLDDVKFSTDGRLKTSDYRVLEPTPTQGSTFTETKPFKSVIGISERLQETQAAAKRLETVLRRQSGDNLLSPAGNLGREEDTPSRLKANLGQLYEEDAALDAVESGGGDIAYAEANLALQFITQALGGQPRQPAAKSSLESILERQSTVEEAGAPVSLDEESGARSGTQQGASVTAFKLNAGETPLQALTKIARAHDIKLSGQYENRAGNKTFGTLPLEVLVRKVQDVGVELPPEITGAKTRGGRKPAPAKGTTITSL